MTEDQKCYTCRWGWDFDSEVYVEGDSGTCHRHAPFPYTSSVNAADLTRWTDWPSVSNSDGCGDWTSRFS
jgi:hypothetical protein